MKNNKLNIAKGSFMLILAICILISSARLYFHSTSENVSAKKETKSDEKKEDKKVSEAHGFEAVIASILNHDFVKYIICFSFDFRFTKETKVVSTKSFFIPEKYLSTLFTHIISPNAP